MSAKTMRAMLFDRPGLPSRDFSRNAFRNAMKGLL